MVILCLLRIPRPHRWFRFSSPLIRGCWFSSKPHLCIVGSGPSAFYTAQFLLRHHTSVCVDLYEKLPAPFGLVRYGVAPDHAEVKNVINTFTEVARNPRVNFFGNVTVGTDVTLQELRRAYVAVILAYGASVDRLLGISGENLPGVLSAKDFVRWYNGAPDLTNFRPHLDCDTVAVIGMGNVAIDVARILLSPISCLKTTDIPESVIAVLSKSKVRRVVIVGRRGLLQAAFTLKEFRELSRLQLTGETSSLININLLPPDVVQLSLGPEEQIDQLLSELPRPRRRLTQFLLQVKDERRTAPLTDKQCDFLFLRSPVQLLSSDSSATQPDLCRVSKVELAVNQLIGAPSEYQQISINSDAPTEFLDCGLVIRSIGYRSVNIDSDLPFDEDRGVIATKDNHGRVVVPMGASEDPIACPVYCTGWVKRGATGVIVNTAMDSRSTAEAILVDLATAEIQGHPQVLNKHGFSIISPLLQDRGVRVISFADWERVDATERSAGRKLGKPREKLTSVESILKAAFSEVSQHKRDNSS